jgi:UDP-N-acetylglucosamine--N-acetylmuramyl-(pentapeptide) pyrophosphoryl-undecaprenol N-acetylglucosamine transferase
MPQPASPSRRSPHQLQALIEAPERLEAMAAAAHAVGRPDAAARLADIVAELVSAPATIPSGVAA